MNGQPEVEEIEITRVEKLLLVCLVGFLLVGSFWAVARIEASVPRPVLQAHESFGERIFGMEEQESGPSIEDEVGVALARSKVQQLERANTAKAEVLANRRRAWEAAKQRYEVGREEYRTAMEAGRLSAELRSAHERAKTEYESISRSLEVAEAEHSKGLASAERPQRELAMLERRASDIYEQRLRSRLVKLFALHFGYAGLCAGLAWIVWQEGRKRRWRYLSILTAGLAAAFIQLGLLAFRYCWELFLKDVAVLGVSTLGTVVTILAIIAVKRTLFHPVRVARSRLASRRCPICATAFEPGQAHCWDCGKALAEPCTSCGAQRLLFAAYCGSCGARSAEVGLSD